MIVAACSPGWALAAAAAGRTFAQEAQGWPLIGSPPLPKPPGERTR